MRNTIIYLAFILFFIQPKIVYAVEDPLNTPNNKYGIHIIDESDIDNASSLVNSSGGDWGYVTMVIRKDERDIKRWQKVFDKMRRLHLIPIIRIASIQQDGGWEKLNIEDVDNWVYFLNSLNWVVKNRYVIIGNEVNHADEWGGEIKPEEYVSSLCNFSHKLKNASDDFFIIHSGLDASAPNNKKHMDEEKYILEEFKSNNKYFDCFDGWSSHSYPNPNFSGLVTATGKGSIKTYLWEENILKNLGFKDTLPIFITETGWASNMYQNKNKYLNPDIVANNLKYSFENVWKENNIVAITPFLLNYTDPPFNVFSWKKTDGSFYPIFDEIKNIVKISGKPIQIENGDIKFAFIPKISKSGTLVTAAIIVSNEGQSIWDRNSLHIVIKPEGGNEYRSDIYSDIEPGKTQIVSIRLNIPENLEVLRGEIYLISNDNKISNSYNFEILTIRPKSEKEDLFSYIKNIIQAWVTKKRNK